MGVAALHPQEGLLVGHAYGGWYKEALEAGGQYLCTPGTPTGPSLAGGPGRYPVSGAGWCDKEAAPYCPNDSLQCWGPVPGIGRLTPAENLMEENPEGPDVRLDGVMPRESMPLGQSTYKGCCGHRRDRCPPAIRHTCWGPGGHPCSRDRPEEPGMVGNCAVRTHTMSWLPGS